MKKIATAAILLMTAGSVFAATETATTNTMPQQMGEHDGDHGRNEHRGPGGFLNTNMPVTTVSQLNTVKEDQKILLEGYLVKQVNKKEFEFKDATGTTTVKIDCRAFRGAMITPNDQVKLFGKADKEDGKTEVKIKFVMPTAPVAQK